MSKMNKDAADRRLAVLIPQFNNAILKKDLSAASVILLDIQDVLIRIANNARLVEFRNKYFELALDIREYDLAIKGFEANRNRIGKNTRLYLEATALLAICYLRKEEFNQAKPYITEVLQNTHVIKSEATRLKFKKEMIDRFNEEAIMMTLLSKPSSDQQKIQEIQEKVSAGIEGKTEEELFRLIGRELPKQSKEMLSMVDSFSKKQLPFNEQKSLPSTEVQLEDENAGRTVFNSFKRVLYNSICDPNSEVYKAWYTNGIGRLHPKNTIIGAIAGSLMGYGIVQTMIIVSAVSLVLRFGLDVYCDFYKPTGVMETRRRK